LEREGNPSSEVIRAAFVGRAAKQLQRGKAYFVDSDIRLKDVFHINKLATGMENVQIPGTAIGFDFLIASGTMGNSMPMETFLSWYREKYPDSDVAADISYLVHTRYQLQPSDGLPYFNYKNTEAFLDDVQRSHTERIQFKVKLQQAFTQINERTVGEADKTIFIGERKERKRSAYVLDLLKEFSKDLESGDIQVYLPPENLKESPEVCKAIDLLANDKKVSKDEAKVTVLLRIANGESKLRSTYIDQLKTSGFNLNEELCKAIEKICAGNLGMERAVNVMFAATNFIIEISDKVEALDKETSKLIKNLYNKISTSI
jgi:hypothetical protein